MPWEEVVTFLGGVSAISLTIGYLGKKVIEAFLTSRIETYKSNLEKITTEHSVQFASLHSKRAVVIAEIYELLCDVENQVRLLATPVVESGEISRDDRYESTEELLFQLFEKYNKTRIYFSEDACKKIDKFIDESKLPINFYKVAVKVSEQDPEMLQENLHKELCRKFTEVHDSVEANIPQARKAVENEFRKILGAI